MYTCTAGQTHSAAPSCCTHICSGFKHARVLTQNATAMIMVMMMLALMMMMMMLMMLIMMIVMTLVTMTVILLSAVAAVLTML